MVNAPILLAIVEHIPRSANISIFSISAIRIQPSPLVSWTLHSSLNLIHFNLQTFPIYKSGLRLSPKNIRITPPPLLIWVAYALSGAFIWIIMILMQNTQVNCCNVPSQTKYVIHYYTYTCIVHILKEAAGEKLQIIIIIPLYNMHYVCAFDMPTSIHSQHKYPSVIWTKSLLVGTLKSFSFRNTYALLHDKIYIDFVGIQATSFK